MGGTTVELIMFVVVIVGAVCMLLGFVLVARGIGAADSESTIKLIGVEIRVSRVGPGVLFAIIGAVLIGQAVTRLPGETAKSVLAEAAVPPVSTPARAETAEVAVADRDTVGEPPRTQPEARPISAPPVDRDPAPDRIRENRDRAEMIERETAGLRAVLTVEATGVCPEALVGPGLLEACRREQPMLGQMLSQKGEITDIQLLGLQQSPFGMMNAYRVDFTGGTMRWFIQIGTDGRVWTLWAPA